MRKFFLLLALTVATCGLVLSGLVFAQKPKARSIGKKNQALAAQLRQQARPAAEPAKAKQQEEQKKGNKGYIFRAKR